MHEPRWRTALGRAGGTSLRVHHVAETDGTYSITDDIRQLSRQAGVPYVGAQLQQRRGAAERIGLVMGIMGGVGALLAIVAVLIAWLLGAF